MIDFETLAVTPNAQVLSLGAVIEGPGIKKERMWFFEQAHQGRSIDPDTEAWWSRQGPDAQKVFESCDAEGVSLKQFCEEFIDWVRPASHMKVWGNGATFDVSIIEDILRSNGFKAPWRFFNIRCYRTVKDLHHIDLGIDFVGVKHNALDDARHQMKCLMRWLKK